MLLILKFNREENECGQSYDAFDQVLSPAAKDKADAEEIIGKIATILPRGNTEEERNRADFLFEAFSGETGEHQYSWFGAKKRKEGE